MAVNYEKKPSAEPVTVTPPEPVPPTVVIPGFADIPEDIVDRSQDPLFLAVLTGAVTKHGVEHYSLANEGSIKGRVQALITATEKIKGALQNHGID